MWAEAYLQQARSDWQMWRIIREQELPECHLLHYLQMACEKLGKAFLVAGTTITPEQVGSSHIAFKRFLQVASRNPKLQKLLKMTTSQFRSHIKAMLPIAEEIERLTPALARGGPNVEYPWESPDNRIHIPVSHSFPVFAKLLEPSGNNLLKLINLVQKNFYHLFAEL